MYLAGKAWVSSPKASYRLAGGCFFVQVKSPQIFSLVVTLA